MILGTKLNIIIHITTGMFLYVLYSGFQTLAYNATWLPICSNKDSRLYFVGSGLTQCHENVQKYTGGAQRRSIIFTDNS